MKRYPHYWYPLKGRACPSRIGVLDCNPATCRPFPGGGAQSVAMTNWCLSVIGTGRRSGGIPTTQSGTDSVTLWRCLSSLLSRKDRLWLFCPDAGRVLDLIGFWRRLEDGEIRLYGRDWRDQRSEGADGEDKTPGICVVEDPPTVILCQVLGRPGKLLLLDVQNWGIELIEGKGDCHERSARYLSGIRDCLSTLRQGNACSVRGTAASQAVCSLRTNYDCVRLHCHTNAAALQLERSALYGGRCEAYRLGELQGPLYHLDVRSMYPSICLTLPVPVSLRRYHAEPSAIQRASSEGGGTCVADVEIRCPDPIYPVRRGEYTLYPIGSYRTTLCGPELAAAVRCDHIARWYAGAEYTCAPYLAPFYAWWLSRLSAARAAGQVMECQWIKRVMNCLPGKFAEPGRQWHAYPPLMGSGPYGRFSGTGPDGTDVRYRNIAWNTQWEEVNGESYWSIPAIAAWITAAGRQKLWNYITVAGREHVRYVDTDAVICDRTGFDRLLYGGHIREGEAGHLRLLGRHRSGVIYGIRHYSLDSAITCAGVQRGSIGHGETRKDWWRRQRIAEQVAVGRRPDARVITIPLPTALDYRHGVVHDDGSVTPWELDCGE